MKKLTDKTINITKIKQKFFDFTKPTISTPKQTKRQENLNQLIDKYNNKVKAKT